MPCELVFAVGFPTVFERGVAQSTDAHFQRNALQVMRGNAMTVQKPQHQFVVGGLFKRQIERAKALIHFFFDEKRRVWRHPAVEEAAAFNQTRVPNPHNVVEFVFKKRQIAVKGVNVFLLERLHDTLDSVIVGVHIVRVQKTNHIDVAKRRPLFMPS